MPAPEATLAADDAEMTASRRAFYDFDAPIKEIFHAGISR